MGTKYEQDVRPQPFQLKQVELFETVQGEGMYIGVPSVFFRTGMCNLSCPGCDTKWDRWQERSIYEIASDIQHRYKSKHVVITGGEPTLHQNGLGMLVELLNGLVITVESNGSVPITNQSLLDRVNLWSFSPKVGTLGHDECFKHSVVLENFVRTNKRNQIKYVLDPLIPAHADSVFEFQQKVDNLPPYARVADDRIFFQPYDRTCAVNVFKAIEPMAAQVEREYIRDLSRLTDLVMKRSGSRFRVLPQMHKLLVYR